jgi:carboxymethylenebutenolidase
MKKHYLLLLTLFLLACKNQNTNNIETDKQDDMTQFADDQKFKEAHDQPEAIELKSVGKTISFPTPDETDGTAFAILPQEKTKKHLFVIHEWWGLNDHIKQEAQRLYDELDNVAVLALDMYDGQFTDDPDKAGQLMQSVTQERAEAIIKGALAFAGKDAEIGTIGWCFGGGWSLHAAIMAGQQGIACVMYYGMPVQNAAELAPIEADILGIFAQNDGWITPEVATNFENLAKATGKDIEIHQFDADHAFANPSNPNFDAEAAQRANALALDFLRDRL